MHSEWHVAGRDRLEQVERRCLQLAGRALLTHKVSHDRAARYARLRYRTARLSNRFSSFPMIDGRLIAPPSPPTSPRMSEAAAKTSEYQWQARHVAAPNAPSTIQPQTQSISAAAQLQYLREQAGNTNRPPLRSHRSFPLGFDSSSRPQHEAGQDQPDASALLRFGERLGSQAPQLVGPSDLPSTTFGGSAPTSPAGRLTPRSPGGDLGDEQLEDEDMDFETAEQGEEEDRPPMTAAELRAHKRKMKRFRLVYQATADRPMNLLTSS